jgi:hypothetical protein
MPSSLLKMRKKWAARIDGWVIFTPLPLFLEYFNEESLNFPALSASTIGVVL